MKRIIHIILTSILLLFSFTISASAEQVSSTTAGFSNIPFSNGYYGFCIDEKLKGAETGDSFTSAGSTSVANNNIDGSDVSQKLKILFTVCFEDIFISDGNGEYIIDSYKAGSSVQSAIWNITDGHYIWGESKSFVDKVNSYDGPDIPDEGYSKVLANGDVINFFFAVVEPQKEGQQSFFAYKITVGQDSTHKHEFNDKWESDDNNHWHECECDEKADVEKHDGTTADCKNPSICEVCGKTLGDVNADNHTGETEIRNAKPSTEFEDGYTGDTYCKDCGKLLEKGKTIPATHKHEFSDKWESDDNNHWHECECDEKADVEKHTVSNGFCTVCDKSVKDGGNHYDIRLDLDSILGLIPDMDSFDFIFGLIPDFDSGNNNDNGIHSDSATEADKNDDAEIPDTGSDSRIPCIYITILLSALVLTLTLYFKKRKIAE